MKIVLFSYKLARGGIERIISLLSLYLPDRIKTTIVLLEDEISYPYKGEVRLLKALKLKPGLINRSKVFIQRYMELKKILAQTDPHYLITFSVTSSFLALLLFSRTIVTVHNSPSLIFGIKFYHRLMQKFVYAHAYKIVVVSEGIKNDLKEKFGVKKKIDVIYNPVDIKNISLLAKEAGFDRIFQEWKEKNIPILITAGTLTEQKAQHHLLRAFACLRKQIECRLVILGSGERKDYLVKLSRELSIENEVLFLGFQKNPYKYFANADIFVFSSLYEGFGMALLEAMACGLPVISVDCYSGPHEILDPDVDINHQIKSIRYAKYGILVPVCDGVLYNGKEKLTLEEIIFSQAMLELLQNSKIRKKYADLALNRSKDFDVSIYVQQWLELLNN